jgi:hypothetical protein
MPATAYPFRFASSEDVSPASVDIVDLGLLGIHLELMTAAVR